MNQDKPQPALDPGFQFLNTAEQSYGRLFYAAKMKGEVEIDLGSASTASQMRMKLYAFRRKIRGEQGKKANFPKLSFLMEDLVVTVEGGKIIVRDHVESPPLKAVESVVDAALAEFADMGVDPFAVDVPGAPEVNAAAPASPEPSASELEASRQRMLERLKQESPELYADNPYYTRES